MSTNSVSRVQSTSDHWYSLSAIPKRLGQLVNKIKEVVTALFRFLFPCCFAKPVEKVNPIPSPLNIPPKPKAKTDEPLSNSIVLVTTDSPGISSTPVAIGRPGTLDDLPPLVVKNGTGKWVDAILHMKENHVQYDKNSPPVRADQINGTKSLPDKEARGAFCIVLAAIDELCEALANNQAVTPELLDGIMAKGRECYHKCAGGRAPIEYLEILEAIYQAHEIKHGPMTELITSLRGEAKENRPIGAVLFEGGMKNPKVYGLFAQKNPEGRVEYFFFDPYKPFIKKMMEGAVCNYFAGKAVSMVPLVAAELEWE